MAGIWLGVGWIRSYGLKGITPNDIESQRFWLLTPPCSYNFAGFHMKIVKNRDFPSNVGIYGPTLENHSHG